MTIEDEAQIYAELFLIADRLIQSAMCAAVAMQFAQTEDDGRSSVPAGTAQHRQNVRDCLTALASYTEALAI